MEGLWDSEVVAGLTIASSDGVSQQVRSDSMNHNMAATPLLHSASHT